METTSSEEQNGPAETQAAAASQTPERAPRKRAPRRATAAAAAPDAGGTEPAAPEPVVAAPVAPEPGGTDAVGTAADGQAQSAADAGAEAAEVPVKKTARRRSPAKRATAADAVVGPGDAEAADAQTGAATDNSAPEATETEAPVAETGTGEAAAPKAARATRTRTTRTRKAAADAAPAASQDTGSAPQEADAAKHAAPEAAVSVPTGTEDTDASATATPTADASAAAGDQGATRTRKAPARRTRKASSVATDTTPPGDEATTATQTAATQAPAIQAPVVEAQPDAEASTPSATDAGTAPETAASEAASGTQEANTAGEQAAAQAPSPVANPFAIPESPVSLLFHAPDLSAVVVPRPKPEAEAPEDDEDENEDTGGRSRGRRTRRTRGRSHSEAQDGGESNGSGSGTAHGPSTEDDGVSSRRRRRRRRGDADLELTGGQDDDPPNTVTRVRGPRAAAEPVVSNKVTSVKGSTRLEAKRQRRRESRETGRRRHVITEAEFLARRESVDRQMIVRQREDRIQIGVLEDGILAEHFVSKTQQDSLIGNVYVGKVQNVLPSMEAAFVDIGRGRNAVLYAGEVNWDVAGLEGQPRRIEHALKSGDSVLVQVTKDPVGHKGARLTSQISLPGRYLVFVPGGSMTGISRKLPDVERNRLKKILKDHLPQNAGVIVRTAAEGASEQELMNDINRLRAQWEEIERKSTSTKTTPPELLYGEPDLTIKVVRDVFNEDFSKLVVSGEEAWDTIEAYVMYVAPDLLSRLEQWTKDEDIFAAHRIEEQIHKALERKVFLPSGGSLVIDRTEAMTVVDVNTGKFTGSGGNLEETVTKNNLEAAEEIVRQLRLRDIGGIIVIDFIDMVLEANRDLVLRRLVECLGRDRTKHQVAEVTSLGLVQMTRKRMGTGLLEVFSENCEACNGRGVVTHEEPVEHQRSYTSQGEPHGSGRGNNSKADRGERRRRGKGQDREADAGQEAVTAAEETRDPEREAKAEAARAAFASIAAAAAAAHGHEGGQQGHGAETAGTARGAASPSATGTHGGSAQDGSTREGSAQDDSGQDARQGGNGAEQGRAPRKGRNRGRGRGNNAHAQHEQERTHAPASSGNEGEGRQQETRPVHDAGVPAAAHDAASQPAEAGPVEDGPVVNIGGEEVRLPRARRSRRATAPTQAPELTLDGLSAVFAGNTPAASGSTHAAEGNTPAATVPADAPAASGAAEQRQAPAQSTAVEPESALAGHAGIQPATGVVPVAASAPAAAGDAATAGAQAATNRQPAAPAHEPAAPARRARRNRSASSAQGSASEPIERHDGPAARAQASGAARVAKLPAQGAEPEAAAPAETPMVLGVGVPASEL